MDEEVFNLIKKETQRQKYGLELIPSENYVSRDVLEAMGSILTNKYSEGYPGKRYYGGQEYIDQIEELAIERGLKVFNLSSKKWHLNVQPYSGSPANIAVYFALAEFGDTIMGMNLTMGGHLTHGHPVNFSGRAYKFVQYGVRKNDHRLDYDEIFAIAKRVKPKIIVSGATAYPRIIDFKRFGEIAKNVGALHMADISHIAGLIVAKVHPSPFLHSDIVTTTTHKTFRGPRSAVIYCRTEHTKAIDRSVFPGLQGGPHEHTIAAKAVAFKEAISPEFKKYGTQIVRNAKTLAAELSKRSYDLVSGGTDNHLLLIDLTNKNITGKEAQAVLDSVGITLNKNTVPYEKRSPFDPSGVRLGTPALTSRGMKEKEMKVVARLIDECLKNMDNRAVLAKIRKEVRAFASQFPVPGTK